MNKLKGKEKAYIRFLEEDDFNVLFKILDRGIDPNLTRADGFAAIHVAVELGEKEAVERLLTYKGINVDLYTIVGFSPIHMAAARGFNDILKLLLKHGANINTLDNFSRTPLHTAIFFNNLKITKILVANSIDINAMDAFGYTPLALAITLHRNELVTYLKSKHADVNKKQDTLLGVFLESILQTRNMKKLEMIKQLVDDGCDINSSESIGKRTALHLAAMTGYGPLIMYLIDMGADRNAKNSNNETPLDVAKNFKHNYAVLLFNYYPKELNKIPNLRSSRSLETIDELEDEYLILESDF